MFLSEGTAIYELPKAFPFGRPNPRGLFPQSLPLWGRWPSEARSDEVVNRIRLLLHLHRLFYSLCPMLGRIFCGGFPAQETSALAHIAVELPRLKSAGGTRRFSEGNSDRGTSQSLPLWGNSPRGFGPQKGKALETCRQENPFLGLLSMFERLTTSSVPRFHLPKSNRPRRHVPARPHIQYYPQNVLAPSMAPQLSLTIRLHSRIWE